MIDINEALRLAFENAHLRHRVSKLSEEKERARVALTEVEEDKLHAECAVTLIEDEVAELRRRNVALEAQRNHAWLTIGEPVSFVPPHSGFSLGTLLVAFMIGLVAGAGGLVLASHFF